MLIELNFDDSAPLNLPVLRIVILVQETGHMWKRIRPESEGSGSLGGEEPSNRFFVILRLIISALPTEKKEHIPGP